MTWKEAFRRQAVSDYEVYKQLSSKDSEAALCHRLHFLQMATEKLAKSWMIGPSDELPRKTHAALVDFLRLLPGNPDLRARFDFQNKHQAFKSYIDKLCPLAKKIQDLAPTGEIEQMNPEYPWLNGKKEVVCPKDYDFPEFTYSELVKFATFIDRFLRVTT